jgi:HSP20 family molecular chaperone IbpA
MSLVIEGEKPSDITDRPYIRKEREFGKFRKSVRLPYRVDMNRIQPR